MDRFGRGQPAVTSAGMELCALGPLVELNRGGVGAIYALPNYRTSPGQEWVLKRNFDPLSWVDAENLQALVEFRDRLAPPERAVLDKYCVWPTTLVRDKGSFVGYLMPMLGPAWFQEAIVEGVGETAPRTADWLLSRAEFGARASVDLPPAGDPIRLVLCAKMAAAMAFLHKYEICFGDVHPANVIFQVEPMPRILLVDCDSAKADPASVFEPATQRAWSSPEQNAGTPQSLRTDRYKLALFVLRCVDAKGGAGAKKIARAKPYLDAIGIDMLRAGLGRDPDGRPTAAEWYSYLRGYLNALTSPPSISKAEIDHTVAWTGTSVKLHWVAQGADELSIETSDGHRRSMSGSVGAGVFEFAATRSGPVRLTATGRFGSRSVLSESVHVFSPPNIRFIDVPEPAVPSLDLDTVFELSDRVRSGFRAMPSGPVVTLPELPDAVAWPSRADTVLSAPDAAAAVRPSLMALSDHLTTVMGEATTLVRQMTTAAPR